MARPRAQGRHEAQNNNEKQDAMGMLRQAFEKALADARSQWGTNVQQPVTVTIEARIDTWNPGGIGVCKVTLEPQNGPI